MSDVTRILESIGQGDPQASRQLLPLVYDELRRLAANRLSCEWPGQTLDATSLVHDAYLRLVGGDPERRWHGRAHFYAAAARSMRRILVDRARHKARLRHGGGRQRVPLSQMDALASLPDERLIELDEALDRFAVKHSREAELVNLRFFAGLSLNDAAESLGVSRATAARDWDFARAWLYDALGG